MSFNTALHPQSNGIILFNGEVIIIYYDGVKFNLKGNTAIPNRTVNGRVFLTTHRVIFTSKKKDALKSFSMPFHVMRNLGLEQPAFGANYIKGDVIAEPNSGWTGQAKFTMSFYNGGAIEFGKAMLEAGRLQSAYRNTIPTSYNSQYDNPYQPPSNQFTGSRQDYRWAPYDKFPDAPPDYDIYMAQNPPPYPGVNGMVPQQNAYQNASAPHDIYVPETQPPAYNSLSQPVEEKKKN
ncbi:hypothetical protein SNEBB_005630 [Seison nebaliae]|nr:hypothetical protein SNEBB_005630 [Seison nebaliae]